MKNVVIIGSGNVAEAMALAVAGSDALRLRQVVARDATAARRLATRCGCKFAALYGRARLAPADLYIIAVSDGAIGEVSKSLDFKGATVAHTAGSVGVRELSSKIAHRAVIYPLQTFSKGRRTVFHNVPLLIEGTTPEALDCVRGVAHALSREVREVDSPHRAKVHLAAVFASNFTNYMYTAGADLLRGSKLDFDILKPLIRETALKAAGVKSPREVQTGPAVRNDYKTKARHVEMLAPDADLQTIYINVSRKIWETSKKK